MSARKRSNEVTQVAPLYVEAEPPMIGVQPVDVSAESVARRIRRPLPYKFEMPVDLIVRRRVATKVVPELSPEVSMLGAMERALERISGGRPSFAERRPASSF